jgi:predicted enzyme related to lactoylglutathione lyase
VSHPPTIGMFDFRCADAAQLAGFWSAVLYKAVDAGATADYATIDFDGDGPTWMFVRAPQPAGDNVRFALDLTHPDYEAEARRIEALGATRIADEQQGPVRWTVFNDPDGTTFRLFAPRPAT